MAADDWEPVHTFGPEELTLTIPWHFLLEIADSYTLLCLRAEGQWDCLGTAIRPCGPDGHASLYLPDVRLLLVSSPPGALIGKFGGSTAGKESAPSAFGIGSRCVVAMPEKRPAALFIAINGALQETPPTLTNFRLEILGVGPP
jgi:hypothetical protein